MSLILDPISLNADISRTSISFAVISLWPTRSDHWRANLFDNRHTTSLVEFRERATKHCCVIRELNENWNKEFDRSWLSRTFTRFCQSDVFPFPSFIRFIVRGMFLMPLRWFCKELTVLIFSGKEKHSTASCLASITERDREGRRSHVLSKARPSKVFVLFRIPSRPSYFSGGLLIPSSLP